MATYKSFNEIFAILMEKTINYNQVARAVAQYAADYYMDAFRTQTWDGDKWPELKSESYKKWKDKQGKGSDANLVLNGDLEEELLKCLNNAISSASVRSGIHFKIESEYAARHNFGTEGMPKRQFIGATKELEEHLTIIATEEAQKILNSI